MIPSKEDILKPLVIHYHLTTRAQQRWSDAMDEYAKEIAIGFHKWLNKESYHYDYRGEEFTKFRDNNHYTHEQLFQSYLNTLIQ